VAQREDSSSGGQTRPIGLDKGKFAVGPEFFEPLPDEFLAYFNGEMP
jgi:hypothetical protein